MKIINATLSFSSDKSPSLNYNENFDSHRHHQFLFSKTRHQLEGEQVKINSLTKLNNIFSQETHQIINHQSEGNDGITNCQQQ